MLVGLRFGVPGLPCLSTALGRDGAAVFGAGGVFLVKFPMKPQSRRLS